MLDDAGTIGAVGELQVEHLGVVLRLLQAIGRQSVLALGLDDRERTVAQVGEEVVDALALAAADRAAATMMRPGVKLTCSRICSSVHRPRKPGRTYVDRCRLRSAHGGALIRRARCKEPATTPRSKSQVDMLR